MSVFVHKKIYILFRSLRRLKVYVNKINEKDPIVLEVRLILRVNSVQEEKIFFVLWEISGVFIIKKKNCMCVWVSFELKLSKNNEYLIHPSKTNNKLSHSYKY